MPMVAISTVEWYPIFMISRDKDGKYYSGRCNVSPEFLSRYERIMSEFDEMQDALKTHSKEGDREYVERVLLRYVSQDEAIHIIEKHHESLDLEYLVSQEEEKAEYSVRKSSNRMSGSESVIQAAEAEIVRAFILEWLR